MLSIVIVTVYGHQNRASPLHKLSNMHDCERDVNDKNLGQLLTLNNSRELTKISHNNV